MFNASGANVFAERLNRGAVNGLGGAKSDGAGVRKRAAGSGQGKQRNVSKRPPDLGQARAAAALQARPVAAGAVAQGTAQVQ